MFILPIHALPATFLSPFHVFLILHQKMSKSCPLIFVNSFHHSTHYTSCSHIHTTAYFFLTASYVLYKKLICFANSCLLRLISCHCFRNQGWKNSTFLIYSYYHDSFLYAFSLYVLLLLHFSLRTC